MEQFIERMEQTLGKDLVLIGEYSRQKRNYVVVVKGLTFAKLQELKPHIHKFYKQTTIYPLLLTLEEVQQGADVFPLDYLNLKNTVTVFHGKNVFANLKIDKKHVRRALEFEVRSKLMNLRRVFLNISSQKETELVLKSAIPTLLPLFNGLLFLKGKTKIDSIDAMLDELTELYKLDFGLLKPLDRNKIDCTDGNVCSLMDFLTELAKLIDKL